METFATAVRADLRFVLSRVPLPKDESFYFNFFDERELEAGPVTPFSARVDPSLARAALAGKAAPSTPQENIDVVAHVLRFGSLRADFAVDDDGGACPWLIKSFFREVDAIGSAAEIAAATGPRTRTASGQGGVDTSGEPTRAADKPDTRL